jgi:hypothetical protein
MLGVGAGRASSSLAPAYPADPRAALPATVLVVAALALAIGGTAALRDGPARFRGLAVLTTLFLLVGLHAVLPAFSAEFVAPAGELARRAAERTRPCDDLVGFGPYRPSLVFYARRPMTFVDVRDRSRLAEIAARPGRLFLVTPRRLQEALPPALAALPTLETRGGYALLASAEGPCP